MKRGQFYLIAVVVIIGVLAGFASVYNSAKISKESSLAYDISSELNSESVYVMNSGAYHDVSEEEISERLQDLAEFYANSNRELQIITFYATNSQITVRKYNSQLSNVGEILIGGSQINFVPGEFSEEEYAELSRNSDSVEISFENGASESFDLKAGKSFFAVVKQDTSSGSFVSGGIN